jgi:hypothetical protein
MRKIDPYERRVLEAFDRGELKSVATKAEVAKLGVRGRFGPRVFTGDTKHCRDGVIVKRHPRLLVLPAGTRNVHVARNDVLGIVGHCSHLNGLK